MSDRNGNELLQTAGACIAFFLLPFVVVILPSVVEQHDRIRRLEQELGLPRLDIKKPQGPPAPIHRPIEQIDPKRMNKYGPDCNELT